MALIHSSTYEPRIYPYNGDLAPAQIDRLQELTGTHTLSREKIEEIGRDGIVGFRQGIPSLSLTARQLEYGTLEFWQKIANVATATDSVNLSDMDTSAFDIAGYKTDSTGTFLATVWYPAFRVQSVGLTIGDPDSLIERSFGFIGEDGIVLQNDSKYFIYKRFAASGGSPETFTVDDPSPTEDPDSSGNYLFRVLRVRGSTTTLLTTSDYTFTSGSGELDITTIAGDIYKVYYAASSYISGSSIFTLNNSDASGLNADSATILLYNAAANTLTRLQSVGIEVSYDRQDVREIGNTDVVERDVRDRTVRITLGRIVATYTIEEVLRGVVGLSFDKLDPRKFTDTNTLIVKLYSDSTKSTFRLGYEFSELAATNIDAGTPLNDFVTQGTTLEGELGFITSNSSNLTA